MYSNLPAQNSKRNKQYYSIEVKPGDESTGNRAIQMIVRDTGLNLGAYGSINQTPLDWLENIVPAGPVNADWNPAKFPHE